MSCIISFLYIKPQQTGQPLTDESSCIISFLYIKPQLGEQINILKKVVLYRFSTSNHNPKLLRIIFSLLYYIVSLHQTTTRLK